MACDQTLSVGADIAAAVASAANSTTICLNAGDYGLVNLEDISRTGFVTLQPADGATVEMTPVVDNSSFIRFDGGAGKTLRFNGAQLLSDACHHIEYLNCVWIPNTEGIALNGLDDSPPATSQEIVFDGCEFVNLTIALWDGRFNIRGMHGVTVRNCLFAGSTNPGEKSDGIMLIGGSRNCEIGPGNIFHGFHQEDAQQGEHIDAIQEFGAGTGNRIFGNYFYDNDAHWQASDGSNGIIMEHNVFDQTDRGAQIKFRSAVDLVFRHNTIYGALSAPILESPEPGGGGTFNALVQDNIFAGGADLVVNDCSGCTIDNNMFESGGVGTNIVIGTPTFVGGAEPTTYEGYALAPGSAGENAGSDAQDVGILLASPVITSPLTALGTVGQAFSYQITAINDPTSFDATPLPAGLTVNTSTGVISGTPTTPGATNVTISATNAEGSGNAVLVIEIEAESGSQNFAQYAAHTGTTYASRTNTTLAPPLKGGESEIPDGDILAIVFVLVTQGVDPPTPTFPAGFTVLNTPVVVTDATDFRGVAYLAWKVASGESGDYTITHATANSDGMVIRVEGGDSGVTPTFSANTGNSETTTALGVTTPTDNSYVGFIVHNWENYGAGLPPTGTTPVFAERQDSANSLWYYADGTLPTAGVTGNKTQDNQNLAATQPFGAFLVAIGTPAVAPVITSSLTASGTAGQPFSYQITAQNSPTSFGATPLPAGLSVNTATGLISGTPVVDGVSNITISATNAAGTDDEVLVLTVAEPVAAPVITSALGAQAVQGRAFSYAITASNFPTSFNATNLPAGLTVNTSSGVISGTPTVSGEQAITIQAINSGGTDTETLTLTIYPPLPVGLTINPTTGLISGTPSASGAFGVVMTAENADGSDQEILVLTIEPAFTVPVITSPLTAEGTVGQPFIYVLTATGDEVLLDVDEPDLPAGLTWNAELTEISGTPTENGLFSVDMSATNEAGADNEVLALTIGPLPTETPEITSPLTASGTINEAFTYQITATETPFAFSAIGLPNGLTLATATGLISGTPTQDGIFNVTLTAENGAGIGPLAVLVLTIQGVAPEPPGELDVVPAIGTTLEQTRTEFLDEFLAFVGESADSDARDVAERALNRVLIDIWKKRTWQQFVLPTPFVLTTVAGQRHYGLPSYFGRVSNRDGRLRNLTRKADLWPIEREDLQVMYPELGLESAAYPSYYVIQGTQGTAVQPLDTGELLEVLSDSTSDTGIRVVVGGYGLDGEEQRVAATLTGTTPIALGTDPWTFIGTFAKAGPASGTQPTEFHSSFGTVTLRVAGGGKTLGKLAPRESSRKQQILELFPKPIGGQRIAVPIYRLPPGLIYDADPLPWEWKEAIFEGVLIEWKINTGELQFDADIPRPKLKDLIINDNLSRPRQRIRPFTGGYSTEWW